MRNVHSCQQWVQRVTSPVGSDTTHQNAQARGLVLEKMAVAKAKAKATKAARALEKKKVERVSVVRVSEKMEKVRMAKEKVKRQ